MLAPRLPLGPAGLLLLLLLFQLPLPGRPDPEASCDPDGCYALYSQPRSFLEAWRACREQGGNLATLKRAEEAAQVSQLLAGSRQPGPPRLFWIGLQRQPRQCFPQRPLRGFSWVTGEQETAYSNWARAVGAAAGAAGCAAPRCVALDDRDFQWLEGSCAGPVDGYLCRFGFRGMCAGLKAGEEGASVAYQAPFGQLATSASAVGAPPRFLPFGTVASLGCPGGSSLLSLLCLQKEDGRVGWSKNPPLCRDPSGGGASSSSSSSSSSSAAASASSASWCEGDNGGCQQLCVDEGSGYACECHTGYLLLPDGHSCATHDPCRHRPCQFDCVAEEEEEESGDGYRCRCPAGYELASDGHQCEDLDECVEATPCEHQCENTEGSFLCRCHLGFSPAEDEPGQCVDTDECQIPGVCQQMCVNYVGGFECYCTEGFDLEADGISCSPVDGLDGPDATPPETWPDDPAFHVRFTTREADDLSAQPPPPVRFSLFSDGEASSSWDSAASFLSVPDRLLFPPPVPSTEAPEFDGAWDPRFSPLEHGFSPPGHSEVLHPTPAASDPPSPPPLLLPTSAVTLTPDDPADLPTPPSPSPSDEKGDPVVEGVRAALPTSPPPSPASSGEGRQRKDDRWLLVALLVPISVFLVIMLALGLVYCTRCGAQAKSRSVTQCYRWVVNPSEKTAPPASANRPCQPATCRTSV